MKMYKKITSLLLSIIMLLSLAACGTESGEVTTDLPETSALDTTEEVTEPVPETTDPLSELYSMDALELLRYANKKTRNYKSYTKTTEITVNYPDSEPESRETVYMKNKDDYSQTVYINDGLDSFIMYSGGNFAIMESFMGSLVYQIACESETQYEKLVGDRPTIKGQMLFDFAGNGNFSDGLVSHGDEGFVISIDLSDEGKKLLIEDLSTSKDKYSIGKASIVAFLDLEGSIQSVAFEAEITTTQFGEEVTMSIATHSDIENVNEGLPVTIPEGMEVYNFEKFDTFYDFYGRATYNAARALNYGYDFGFTRTLRINRIENNSNTTDFLQSVKARYVIDSGLNYIAETTVGDVTTSVAYYYVIEDGLTYHIENGGEAVIRHDMTAQDVYDMVVGGMFGNYVGKYDTENQISAQTSSIYGYYYSLQIKKETAMELARSYLSLCGIDPDKCDEIIVVNATNRCSADSKNDEIDGFGIYLDIDVKYEGRNFNILVKDELDQFTSSNATFNGPPESLKP